MSSHESLSRRKFIQTGAAAGALGVAGCAKPGKEIAMAPEKVPHVEPAKSPAGAVAKKPVAGDRIRVGFIAIGGRGGGLLNEVVKFDNVDVVALCDIKEERTKWAAGVVEEKHKARPNFKKPEQYHGSPDIYKELLKRGDVDAVVSAAPCFEHARIYLDCLAAGKHTYGEKPMCISAKECRDLIAAEAKSTAILQIGFQRRWNPNYTESIKLVHAGECGELMDGRAAWSNAWGPLVGWFGRTKESGDWMLEQACHSWDVLNWVTGGIAQWAWGFGRKDLYLEQQKDRDVHDYYLATIGWPGRLVVHFLHTWMSPPDAGFPGVYEKVAGPKAGVDLGSGTFSYRRKEDNKKQVGRGVNDTYEAFKAFFDCCKNGKQPASGVLNGANATYVGLLVRKAVNENRLVTMEEVLKEG